MDRTSATLLPDGLRERHVGGGLVVLFAAALSLFAAPRLPATLVTHWGPSGPDGTMARTTALAGLPLLAAGMVLLFEVLPRIDPLGEAIRDLGRYYDGLVVAVAGLIAYVHLLVVLWNLGYRVDVLQAIVPAVAFLYYVVGVVLGRVDRNWFLGVRTPWTLSSDEVWERTHALAGPLFKVSAVLALLAIVVPSLATAVIVGPILVSVVLLTVYSYVLYADLDPTPDDNA